MFSEPDDFASRRFQAYLFHRLLEEKTVFGHLDRAHLRSDHFDAVRFEYSRFCELDRDVQRCLSADCREQSIGTFALDDGFNKVLGQRLHVGAIGQFRVGHNRRRIAVDEHHLEPFGP